MQSYFLTAPNSIAKLWLARGAGGWRMDVSGDPSFPDGYWETFRSVVKATSPSALTVSETWPKDTTLLRMLRGDRLDTTMNYRLRDAVIGLLAPQAFDAKGFPDSGQPLLPSQFANRLASTYEDNPEPAAANFMNLLDSHDTERLRWTLTPGAETRAAREQDAANVAEGKARMKLASLVQFTVPGAPTVYYGDEVGVTGDDDPDDRRTMPWSGPAARTTPTCSATTGRCRSCAAPYRRSRSATSACCWPTTPRAPWRSGARRRPGRDRGAQPQRTAADAVHPGRRLHADGTAFSPRFGAASAATVADGTLTVSLPARSGAVLATGLVDLLPPARPRLRRPWKARGRSGSRGTPSPAPRPTTSTAAPSRAAAT